MIGNSIREAAQINHFAKINNSERAFVHIVKQHVLNDATVYKNPRPEPVYDVYMKYLKDVEFELG